MPNTNKYNKIIIDKQIYPIEAALSAGYALSDELYIYLDLEGKDKIAVYIKPKKEKVDRNKWEEEFLNQLLYEAEKIAVSKRNKKVREFIVGRALFSSVESVSANNDNYEDDPLGISAPWEEKYESEEGDEEEEKESQSEVENTVNNKQKESDQEGFEIAVPWGEEDKTSEQ